MDNVLIIATIETEQKETGYGHPFTQWVVSWSHVTTSLIPAEPFLVFRTGNHDEAHDMPVSMMEHFGYSTDEIDVHYNY